MAIDAELRHEPVYHRAAIVMQNKVISRVRLELACSIGILACAAACSDTPTVLPPGIVDLDIGMPIKDVQERRKTMSVKSPARAFDPIERIALALKDDKVTGIRIFIPSPADEVIQEYYATHFKNARTSQYQYQIEGKNLSIYAVSGGIELLYGEDPGGTAISEGPKKQGKDEAKNRGIVHLRQGPTLNQPKYFPVARSSEGITVWLQPIGEPTNGPASLKIFINSGSSDEIPAERGVTAVIAELLALKISPFARDNSVQIQHFIFRSGTLFSFDGFAKDVQATGIEFARNLQSLSSKKFTSDDITRAFQASLRNSLDTNLEHKLIEDEGFASAFPGTRFAHSPVDKEYAVPSETVLTQRSKTLSQAALKIVAAGAIGPRFAQPIVKAFGSRANTPFSPLPESDKTKRMSRKVLSPMLAVDGFITTTSSISSLAQLFVAGEYLSWKLGKSTLSSKGINLGSQSVVVGGQNGARFLMSIATARGAMYQDANNALENFWTTLSTEDLDEAEFVKIRQGAISAFSSAWSTSTSATDIMLRLVMMGLAVEEVRSLWSELEKVQKQQVESLLEKHTQADKRFSVRWGPQL